MINVLITIGIVIAAIFVLLFIIYFFNLDMKFMVCVVAPILEKHYNKRKRKQYL